MRNSREPVLKLRQESMKFFAAKLWRFVVLCVSRHDDQWKMFIMELSWRLKWVKIRWKSAPHGQLSPSEMSTTEISVQIHLKQNPHVSLSLERKSPKTYGTCLHEVHCCESTLAGLNLRWHLLWSVGGQLATPQQQLRHRTLAHSAMTAN